LDINSRLPWKELFVMKRHVTASAVSLGKRNEGGASESVANRAPAQLNEDTLPEPVSIEPSLVVSRLASRTHTLVLSGELDHRSAHTLEAELERLCEEGVTGITLDLRELTYIDSVGVAVIVFRCGLCKRRGCDFALIRGSRSIHRAFVQAAVSDLLPFQEDNVAAARPPALVLDQRSVSVGE
jgi:anti-anti-sigma factor